MALDFSALPPEEPVPDKPPSRFLWTMVFVVLTLVGSFIVLMVWPADEPTHTPLFFTCVSVVPMGIAAFVVLRRYSSYEGRRLDALEWNKACKRYRAGEFERESIPMLVLGSSLRVSGGEETDVIEDITDGTLVLDAKSSDHEENESMSVRWLEPREARLAADDAERHALVLEWLYDRLQKDLTEPINALPAELDLYVRLEVSGYRGDVDSLSLWNDGWRANRMRAVRASVASEAPGPMVLDSWLDDGNGPLAKAPLLLVSISLNALMEGIPPRGSAEAGVGLLLVSSQISRRHDLRPVAAIHRPVSSPNENLVGSMANVLKWGKTQIQRLDRAWMTGFDGETVGPFHKALDHLDADNPRSEALPELNLDRTVGNAAAAAGWLAVACAVQRVLRVPAPQLVAQHCVDQTVLAVVRNHDEELNNASSPA